MSSFEYNAETTRRVRIAAIGCGGHAMRNIFPTFPFAPVDLVGVCDIDRGRAESCARAYGAAAAFTDYHEMLQEIRPDAVVVVTSYDEHGNPRYPTIACEAMRAGAHAWIEKPPAASSAEVQEMIDASRETGKFVGVGFKKMFFPAYTKAREILDLPEFGPVSAITARYPQWLPPVSERSPSRAMTNFLDHIVHPLSLLRLLAGPTDTVQLERAPSGASIITIRYVSGAVGSLLLAAGQSGRSPMERTEVIGAGANVVIENNIRVIYYRPAAEPGPYGRAETYYGSNDDAPLVWEPEFSLGQLYNKGIFLLGYAPEIRYFCRCVLDNTPPKLGNLDDALELLRIFEALRNADGQTVKVKQG